MDALQGLRDPKDPLALDRAKLVAEISQVMINSAKVEVDFLRVTQQRRSHFMTALPAPREGQ